MPFTQNSRYTGCHSPGLPLGEGEFQNSAQEWIKAVGRSWRGEGGECLKGPMAQAMQAQKLGMKEEEGEGLFLHVCLHSSLMLQIQKKKTPKFQTNSHMLSPEPLLTLLLLLLSIPELEQESYDSEACGRFERVCLHIYCLCFLNVQLRTILTNLNVSCTCFLKREKEKKKLSGTHSWWEHGWKVLSVRN